MGVEPHSLTWVIGQRTPDRTGETWCATLAPWRQVTYVAVDGGSGLRRGLELTYQQRQEPGPALPLEANLDNFHIQQEGQKALRAEWQEAEHVWQEADKADRAVALAERQGRDTRGVKNTARTAWAKAEAALALAERREAAYGRAVAALNLFRPDGLVNDRLWAEAEIEAAVQDLLAARWAKFCRMALDPRALTFLDRLQRELQEAAAQSNARGVAQVVASAASATVGEAFANRGKPRCGVSGHPHLGLPQARCELAICVRAGGARCCAARYGPAAWWNA